MSEKLTYKQFSEMEEAHSKGELIKICENCGRPYKPELRTYNKKTWRLKDIPTIKIQKNGKVKVDKYIKIKHIVGNWIASKYCKRCSKIIGAKESKERREYRKEIFRKIKEANKRQENEK